MHASVWQAPLFEGSGATAPLLALAAATERDLPLDGAALAPQHVESAIFAVAELPQQALIPCCSWLQATLHPPGKPWSRLAPFQG